MYKFEYSILFVLVDYLANILSSPFPTCLLVPPLAKTTCILLIVLSYSSLAKDLISCLISSSCLFQGSSDSSIPIVACASNSLCSLWRFRPRQQYVWLILSSRGLYSK